MSTDHDLTLIRATDPLAVLQGSALTGDSEQLLSSVLARARTRRGSRSKRFRPRVALVCAAMTAVLVVAGVAVGDGTDPFFGIGSADHAATRQDSLDPAVLGEIQSDNARLASLPPLTGQSAGPMQLLPETARLANEFSSGQRLYVISTNNNQLCTLFQPSSSQQGSIGCGNPLSDNQPTTIATEDTVVNGPNATPPIVYGVARNGIASVSFETPSGTVTVPVQANVWFYQGQNSALEHLTVHFDNGTAQDVNH